jgi:hypothetical protein
VDNRGWTVAGVYHCVEQSIRAARGGFMDAGSADQSGAQFVRPSHSIAELLAAKHTKPIQSLDELAADTFASDEELDEFLAYTYAERHREIA